MDRISKSVIAITAAAIIIGMLCMALSCESKPAPVARQWQKMKWLQTGEPAPFEGILLPVKQEAK